MVLIVIIVNFVNCNNYIISVTRFYITNNNKKIIIYYHFEFIIVL